MILDINFSLFNNFLLNFLIGFFSALRLILEWLRRLAKSYFVYSHMIISDRFIQIWCAKRTVSESINQTSYVDNAWRKVGENYCTVYWSIMTMNVELTNIENGENLSFGIKTRFYADFTFDKWCYVLFFHKINFNIIPGSKEREIAKIILLLIPSVSISWNNNYHSDKVYFDTNLYIRQLFSP